jgi:arylsulfatase A-like enzyme
MPTSVHIDDNGLTNHVPLILYGAHVNHGSFGNNYNHYDLLATILGASGLAAPNWQKMQPVSGMEYS